MKRAYILTDSQEICVKADRLVNEGGMLYAYDGEELTAMVALELVISAQINEGRDGK